MQSIIAYVLHVGLDRFVPVKEALVRASVDLEPDDVGFFYSPGASDVLPVGPFVAAIANSSPVKGFKWRTAVYDTLGVLSHEDVSVRKLIFLVLDKCDDLTAYNIRIAMTADVSNYLGCHFHVCCIDTTAPADLADHHPRCSVKKLSVDELTDYVKECYENE
jgi:hypothetical protein